MRYLVEHALDTGGYQLKERTIGMEVFGRDASYDTGKDAIVRVSANGVRKRLLAYYAEPDLARPPGRVKICLPPGSYTVEFQILEPHETGRTEPPGESAALAHTAPGVSGRRWPASAWAVTVALAAGCGVLAYFNRQLVTRVPPAPGMEMLPWSQFGSQKTVRVVLTDVNYTIYYNVLAKRGLTLDEYLGDQWIGAFGPDMASVSPRSGNQYTSVVSAVAAARVSAMLETTGRTALLASARKVAMDQFKGDQPVILLGSAYANPWAEVFRENLTFAIEIDPETRFQYIANHAPLSGEPAHWLPTPATASPRTDYAILSLIPNLTAKGWVLLVAGTSAEGTGAASELLTDPVRLRKELLARSIDPGGGVQRLELLLRVQSQGMDARRYQVIASRAVRD